ncbi:MAG TPA: lysophospholipid acyltransferase family protein [Candidatus Kapabacteria bacterium]|nr:lysophospholipid acyltransferase family protein [Candidatus Kapabacteria bacterium]
MTTESSLSLPLDLPISRSNPFGRSLHAMAHGIAGRLFSFNRLNQVYRSATSRDCGRSFSHRALDALGVELDVDRDASRMLPADGGVIVVANHPFGAVEGLALLAFLTSLRPDVRVLANHLLYHIPELRDVSFFVDPFGTRDSARANIRGMAGALRWVQSGGVLLVFPAGEVSHFDIAQRSVVDPEWNSSIARLVRRGGAPVMPVYVHGHNRLGFQIAGMVHPRLRTALLPRQLVNKQGMRLRMEIGTPIAHERLRGFDDDGAMMRYLRERTYLLASRIRPARQSARPLAASLRREELIEPVEPRLMRAELEGIPVCQILLDTSEYRVVYGEASQMPGILREIGRLREQTFREAGEGTGRACDIDRFDSHYHHLVLWHRTRCEVVGAYRIGQVDQITRWQGTQGLYTRTLFNFDAELIESLGPSLELGRSFVQPAYQRSFAPLMLLWKGIGAYIVRHPRYRVLFGPVSISDEYSTMSQRIMTAFLRAHLSDRERVSLVQPRNPPRSRRRDRAIEGRLALLASSIDDVAALVSEVEQSDCGVPVLLRHYLKLGGKLLGLNRDAEFSNVLDALIYVDLARAEPALLARYMGTEGMKTFLGNHSVLSAEPTP